MDNCIFSAHCTESYCDKSCPILTETSYLLERNNIGMDSAVFTADVKDIETCEKILTSVQDRDRFGVYISEDTIYLSNLLTYCAICNNWKGNRLHCNVYHLKFSSYLEDIQKSWSSKSPNEMLEYKTIWSNTAKILIISNIDFIQFKDFQSQTLLNLIHTRMDNNLTTIVVSPPIHTLIGDTKFGTFFDRLKTILKKAVISWQ